ncbi:MAG: hypothetical protein IJL06_03960, partial [Kiritimatiellae bacterium]|nr:hypothetical protein [Kiritimatiellia bacterium]
LRRAGAYVRRAARHKVKTSDNPSPPGSPPHSRAGLLKRSILFGLDKPAQAVVIGPAESVIGNAMAAHEFGGRYKRERYPARPLMGPTLTSTAPKLAQFWRDSVTD